MSYNLLSRVNEDVHRQERFNQQLESKYGHLVMSEQESKDALSEYDSFLTEDPWVKPAHYDPTEQPLTTSARQDSSKIARNVSPEPGRLGIAPAQPEMQDRTIYFIDQGNSKPVNVGKIVKIGNGSVLVVDKGRNYYQVNKADIKTHTNKDTGKTFLIAPVVAPAGQENITM